MGGTIDLVSFELNPYRVHKQQFVAKDIFQLDPLWRLFDRHSKARCFSDFRSCQLTLQYYPPRHAHIISSPFNETENTTDSFTSSQAV